ncbi:penicillin-binding protein 1C [Bacteroides sp. 519]|uniref:penicillin-binding protein 1C n=1 Tax=Bacteroides sp. 519 TaxID=2302937 RepID=UPI0013D34913|nr:penicillin-binding protein 1C [Bacteroides sp. 519]NDV60640.1 penicillin-binding protein 1C [Bacteroides sp. 519]
MKKPSRKNIFRCIIAILLIWYIFCLPRNLFDVPYSTVVTDRNGELLGARIAEDGQWRFPSRKSVPDKLKTCIIEFEDNYYRWHWGVNPLAIGRATIQNIKKGRVVSGGSTITMQTIRLSRGKDRTWYEKIIEMILATRLEFRYSKNEILALYTSHAPYGGNVVGLDAAAWRYFGHDADQLSWAEAATLAVLPNAPSAIHLSKSRDALLKKRNKLLEKLCKNGTIDTLTYELALNEELPDEPLPLPQTAPHLVDYYFASRKGLESVTTIDKSVQTQIEQLLTRWNSEFSRSDIRNLAALVIDVRTNEVVAYCGNVSFADKRAGSQVDIIRSPRSTGSILKPFLYYIMLNEGEILPNTLLPDIPLNINGFAPQNFNLQFEGAVPASQAIARSLNIPTVNMLRQHGVPKFHSFLKQMGLSTLNRTSSHYGLSLILGGGEATLWEVTAAYAQMGRALLGKQRSRTSLLLSKTDNPQILPEIFTPGAVWQTFQSIKEVNRPEEIDWRIIPSMQTIAWKTGTSYGFRDAWAVGVTPRYAVGVWVGNATGEGKPGLVGARTAGPVMFDIFNILPSSQWFDTPYSEFTETVVCKQSGHLKGRFCEDTDTVMVVPNGLRTVACPYHHQVNLTADEKFRVYENCIGQEATIQRNWLTLPPAWEWYYKQHHAEYKTLPPFKIGCGEDTHNPMQFIYPQMNAQVYLPKQLDGSQGQMTFELVHSHSNAVVYWHLDDEYITATEDFHKITILPSEGKHSMTVVDDEGNTLSVTFQCYAN